MRNLIIVSTRYYNLIGDYLMKTAIFYHAGCPICITAEQQFTSALNPSEYTVEVVHLGDSPEQLVNAETQGVKSVPALVVGGQVFHINFGASIDDLKN